MTNGKKFKFLAQSCVVAVFAALTTAASGSVIVASDNFQSYNTGSLDSANGGTGWAGAWAANNSAVKVVDPAVDLQGDRAIAFTGNDNSAATRTLAAALTGDVFVDFLFQYSGAIDKNDFLGLWFGSSTGPNIGLKGNCGDDTCVNDLFVRTTGSSGSFLASSNLAANTTYHVFGHLYKSTTSGYYDRFDAWLNPTANEMFALTTADASYTGFSSISSISQIGFRSVNLDTDDSMKIDNLSIQVVPEPGVLALVGLALAGLGFSRRRKSS